MSSGVCAAVYLGLTLANAGSRGVYRFQSEPVWLIIGSAARYLGQNTLLWLWPFGNFGLLLVDRPAEHIVQSSVWWVALLASCWMSWRLRRRDRALTFGLGLVRGAARAGGELRSDRQHPRRGPLLYLPGAGLAVALSRSVSMMTEWVSRARPGPMAALVPALGVMLGVSWLPETRRARRRMGG